MKKGEWKIESNYIDDKKMYRVYRTINPAETDHSGNREYATGYIEKRQDAEKAAECLNYGPPFREPVTTRL